MKILTLSYFLGTSASAAIARFTMSCLFTNAAVAISDVFDELKIQDDLRESISEDYVDENGDYHDETTYCDFKEYCETRLI